MHSAPVHMTVVNFTDDDSQLLVTMHSQLVMPLTIRHGQWVFTWPWNSSVVEGPVFKTPMPHAFPRTSPRHGTWGPVDYKFSELSNQVSLVPNAHLLNFVFMNGMREGNGAVRATLFANESFLSHPSPLFELRSPQILFRKRKGVTQRGALSRLAHHVHIGTQLRIVKGLIA